MRTGGIAPSLRLGARLPASSPSSPSPRKRTAPEAYAGRGTELGTPTIMMPAPLGQGHVALKVRSKPHWPLARLVRGRRGLSCSARGRMRMPVPVSQEPMIPASYIKSSSLIALQLPVATQTLDSISIVLQCLRGFGACSIHFGSRWTRRMQEDNGYCNVVLTPSRESLVDKQPAQRRRICLTLTAA